MSIEQKLINFIEINKKEENSYIQYYWNNKAICDVILGSHNNEIQESINNLLITEDFKSEPAKFLDSYLRSREISVKKTEQLIEKLNGIEIEAEADENFFFIFNNITIRGRLPVACNILIDINNKIVKMQTISNAITSEINSKLPLREKKFINFQKEWEAKSKDTLFNELNESIKFEDLSKRKIENLFFSLFDLLCQDYITTEYSNSMDADFIPCKIASPKEILENETEIQFKKENKISLYDHADISFPFEERCIWWLKNYCNNSADKKECFTFSTGYPYGFFNKMDIIIEFGFNSSVGMNCFGMVNYAFIIEGYGEHTEICLYNGKKKKKSCLLKEANGFPEECFKYIEANMQAMLNNPILKFIMNHYIFKPLILKPIKQKFGNQVKNTKLIFTEHFSIDNLNKQLLPIKLKKSGTVFDLSNIKNPHIIENYDEAFVSAIEQNKLHSLLKPDKSIQVNTKKRL